MPFRDDGSPIEIKDEKFIAPLPPRESDEQGADHPMPASTGGGEVRGESQLGAV